MNSLRVAPSAQRRDSRQSPQYGIFATGSDSEVMQAALPLSLPQQRLWFLAQMPGGSEAYHLPVGLRLIGELDSHSLRRALDRIVLRHEVLRTNFQSVDDQPAPLLAPADSGFALQSHDLRLHADKMAGLDELIREAAHRPFDLERSPLIRGELIRLAEREHVLLIVVHHIVADHQSTRLLIGELSALYRAYLTGCEDPSPPLPMQYADYAARQRQHLGGDALQRHSEYWRRALEGAPASLELPTDRPRPPRQMFAGAAVEVRLDATLTRALNALSLRHGMMPSMTVLAGWAQVLSRLAGQEEVVIGATAANRARVETEELIGPFMNMLALRIAVSGTVAELLQRVKAQALEAQHRSELPFERVVEVIQPARSLSHTPIFQVVLAWQQHPLGGADLPGLTLSPVVVPYDVVRFDLELRLGEVGECIAGELAYASSLFDRGNIERHVSYLRVALAAMVADEQQELERIDLLTAAERAAMLQLGKGGPHIGSMPGPADGSLYDLVTAQAERTAQAIAVLEPGAALTYGELVRRANGVARQLSDLGAGPETCVAILTDRSAESIVGVLGILASGAAYVPLDPSYPDERMAFVLNDAAVVALVTPSTLTERANTVARQRPESAGKVVVIAAAPPSAARPRSNVDGGNAAYVIYTSGSTGTPKGVIVEHRGIMNLVRGFIAQHDFAAQRLLMIPPLVFDASIGDVFPALAVGATLVLHPAPAELGAAQLQRFCSEHDVTAIDAPTALWRRWTESLAAEGGSAAVLPQLRLLMFGGESVPLEQVRRFALLTGNRVTLANHYGPTETSVCATMLTTHDAAQFCGTDLPIGRPLPGVQVYVLDRHLQLLPHGAEGELCIGGAGVARGYLGAPALTAERFVSDPFSPDAAARIYRTGDLARWNADGTLQFLGRRDHQVKIRGRRIELGEIEERLVEHPRVCEAVVLAREDSEGDKRLVAYITLIGSAEADASTAPIEAKALRAHLEALLPQYMVPAAYVRLAALPLTSNGKLDRKALPAPDAAAYVTRGYEAPLGEVEIAVAGIWAQILKLGRVGRHDNFFELGGHSLLAVTLIERMRQAGLQADVRALFAAPTLAGLSAAVGATGRAIGVPPNLIPPGCTAITPAMLPLVDLSQSAIDRIVANVSGGAANVQDIYPLAPLQEGFLFHHVLEKEGDVYLAPTLFSIEGRERLERYVDALRTVIHRHDILRTAVAWEGVQEPVQVVWRHAPLTVEEIALDAAAGDIADQLHARFDPRHYRLDVRQAPLWRLFVAEDVANSRWVVLELMHHLVGDHTTLQVMQEEIQAILSGHAERLPAPLPFRNFVAQARMGVSRAEHEAFFSEMLSDVDEPTVPFGLADVMGDGSRIVEAYHDVDPQLCRRLRARSRALGVTAASICHLAWALVLARVSGRDDVVFGTVLFGRMQGGEGADRTMGLFINTLPLRIGVADEGVQESVRKTHGLLTRLLRHEHASLILAQRCSAVRAPAPLFTSILNYRHSGAGDAELVRDVVRIDGESDVVARTATGMKLLGGQERSNYPFDLSISDRGEGLGLNAQVDASVDPQRVCAFMQRALESLVTALEQAPATPTCHLDVLPPEERRRLLTTWNETQTERPEGEYIHELFEAHALRTPDAPAVVFEARTLNYRELNRRANLWAHRLLSLGVKPDDRVAICLERGIEMIVGILAVLKAGGAYVPLDPAHPPERLQYMLQDSAPRVLLTQAALAAALPETSAAVLEMDAAWRGDESRDANPDPRALGLLSTHLAYVIYTSGSTGQPKGVMVEHVNVINLIRAHVRNCALTAADRVLQFASFGFDASVEEIFAPLAAGAAMVLRPAALLTPDESFLRFLQRHRVSVAELPTSFWHQWAQQEKREGSRAELLPRLVVVGGEKAQRPYFDRWRENTQEWCRGWLNTYGPTEATVYATALRVDEGGELPPGEISIGRPIANTRTYILNSHGEPAPIGVAGELYIGGAGVARGYLNRPELTAERFLADPFSTAAGARIYKTGDVARYLPDGSIEYLGRNDHQVKIRGYRIELGEIEAHLVEHPSVREAVVLAREDRPGDLRLVAYIAVAPSSAEAAAKPSVDIDAVRAHLRARLPEYMVPAAYVALAKFSLTQNGKLDRRALPAPDSDAYAERRHEPPVGEVEQVLAHAWAQILKLDRVGRHDNFFDLGGHSLLALQVLDQLRQRGITTTVIDLFNHPTIESLAIAVERASAGARRDAALLVRGGAQTPLFLLHDGYGDEVYFSVLAQHLPMPLPVYGLPAAPLSKPRLRTVQAMAARMVELIRQVCSQGPYCLAGWSFGGVLAYEVAQQLLEQKQAVQFLGLIDAICPQPGDVEACREKTPEQVLMELCERQIAQRPRGGAPAAAASARDLGFDELFDLYRELQALPESLRYLPAQAAHAQCRHLSIHSCAMDRYCPVPIAMPLHLFVASERPADWPARFSSSLGWERCVPAHLLHTSQVPGSHESVMKSPHVGVLGQELARAMASASDCSQPAREHVRS